MTPQTLLQKLNHYHNNDITIRPFNNQFENATIEDDLTVLDTKSNKVIAKIEYENRNHIRFQQLDPSLITDYQLAQLTRYVKEANQANQKHPKLPSKKYQLWLTAEDIKMLKFVTDYQPSKAFLDSLNHLRRG